MRRAALFLLAGTALAASPAAGDVAIVVHPDNPVSRLSATELGDILRLDRRYWSANRPIYLVLQQSGRPEKRVVLERVYRMKDSAELKRFWLAKLYRGEIATFPRVATSNAAVLRLVASSSGAVGFVDADTVDNSVRVVSIDGKLPGEPGYLLAAASARR